MRHPDLETDKVVKRLEELRCRQQTSVPPSYRPLHNAASVAEDVEVTLKAAEVHQPYDDSEPSRVGGSEPADEIRAADAGDGSPDGDGAPAEPVSSDIAGNVRPTSAHLSDRGRLTDTEAVAALDELRESVVRPAMPDWKPHRSILRPAMIETFVQLQIPTKSPPVSEMMAPLDSGMMSPPVGKGRAGYPSLSSFWVEGQS